MAILAARRQGVLQGTVVPKSYARAWLGPRRTEPSWIHNETAMGMYNFDELERVGGRNEDEPLESPRFQIIESDTDEYNFPEQGLVRLDGRLRQFKKSHDFDAGVTYIIFDENGKPFAHFPIYGTQIDDEQGTLP